jgi:hypothetical protein
MHLYQQARRNFRGPGRGYPHSYTIVMAHRVDIAVVSTSKPVRGAIAKVSGGERAPGPIFFEGGYALRWS